MADPFSFTGAARDVWQFLTFLRGVAGANVIAAQFKWDATRTDGSDKITVHKHREDEHPDRFWYEVEAMDDYTFLRFPVVESCAHELVGMVKGQTNPDARYWRWVAPVPPGAIVGGERPNLMVDFVVVGYRPKALLKYFTGAA
jgi:hypothetical protein